MILASVYQSFLKSHFILLTLSTGGPAPSNKWACACYSLTLKRILRKVLQIIRSESTSCRNQSSTKRDAMRHSSAESSSELAASL